MPSSPSWRSPWCALRAPRSASAAPSRRRCRRPPSAPRSASQCSRSPCPPVGRRATSSKRPRGRRTTATTWSCTETTKPFIVTTSLWPCLRAGAVEHCALEAPALMHANRPSAPQVRRRVQGERWRGRDNGAACVPLHAALPGALQRCRLDRPGCRRRGRGGARGRRCRGDVGVRGRQHVAQVFRRGHHGGHLNPPLPLGLRAAAAQPLHPPRPLGRR